MEEKIREYKKSNDSDSYSNLLHHLKNNLEAAVDWTVENFPIEEDRHPLNRLVSRYGYFLITVKDWVVTFSHFHKVLILLPDTQWEWEESAKVMVESVLV